MLCQCHNLSTFSTIQLLPRCFVDLTLSCQIDVIFLPFFFFFFKSLSVKTPVEIK